MKIRTILFSIIIIIVIVASGLWFWSRQEAQASSGAELLEATGVIEAREASMAPEVGGQVVEVLVEEGERVTAGQPVVRLDSSLLTTQREQAQSALQAAKAKLALLEAGANVEQIRAAEAQLAQAKANLRLAQARLNLLTAGSRLEEIEATHKSLLSARQVYPDLRVIITSDQVEAVRLVLTSAKSNWTEALARRNNLADDSRNPRFVLEVAEAGVADAQASMDLAQAAMDAVQDEGHPYYKQLQQLYLAFERAQTNLANAQARYDGLKEKEGITLDGLDAAEATLNDAQMFLDDVEVAYEELKSGLSAAQLDATWDEVQRLQAKLEDFGSADMSSAIAGATPSVEILIAQLDAALAQHDLAVANLAELKRGAQAEEIDAAEAQVAASQAQLDGLNVLLRKHTITAPWDGFVLNRSVETGETVLPGTTLLEIGRLDLLELTVYLPEDRFGLVTPGQSVEVRVDAYPGQIFSGTVLRVADESEFTPTNIQTKDDRVRLVYAAVISLDNPDLALKPGMIADTTFE